MNNASVVGALCVTTNLCFHMHWQGSSKEFGNMYAVPLLACRKKTTSLLHPVLFMYRRQPVLCRSDRYYVHMNTSKYPL